ncbi:hypothetical protein HDU98_004916, partial [Podochytrium sp. JEL0797]
SFIRPHRTTLKPTNGKKRKTRTPVPKPDEIDPTIVDAHMRIHGVGAKRTATCIHCNTLIANRNRYKWERHLREKCAAVSDEVWRDEFKLGPRSRLARHDSPPVHNRHSVSPSFEVLQRPAVKQVESAEDVAATNHFQYFQQDNDEMDHQSRPTTPESPFSPFPVPDSHVSSSSSTAMTWKDVIAMKRPDLNVSPETAMRVVRALRREEGDEERWMLGEGYGVGGEEEGNGVIPERLHVAFLEEVERVVGGGGEQRLDGEVEG